MKTKAAKSKRAFFQIAPGCKLNCRKLFCRLARHRHKAHLHRPLLGYAFLDLFDYDHLLILGPNRNHHLPVHRELINESLRNLVRRCRYDDSVKRRLFGYAKIAVARFHENVFIAQLL